MNCWLLVNFITPQTVFYCNTVITTELFSSILFWLSLHTYAIILVQNIETHNPGRYRVRYIYDY
jgi:hypothetical protein